MLRRTFGLMRSEPRHVQWGVSKQALEKAAAQAKDLGYGRKAAIEFLCAKGVPNKRILFGEGTSEVAMSWFALIMNPPNRE